MPGANPFVPIGPRNSFNRVHIADLPGLTPDPDVRGLTAYEICSRAALVARIEAQRAALGVANCPPDDLPIRFNACFYDADPAARAAAEAIARDFGRGFGLILLALRRGDATNRAARPNWEPEHWAFWAAVRRVAVGGGLLAGELGARLPEHAGAALADYGCPDTQVERLPYGAALPLLGAARLTPPHNRPALVLDFGQTNVKRGVVEGGAHGAITALHLLPTLPAPCEPYLENDPAYGARLLGRMAGLIAASWQAAGGPALAPVICASIALYIADGQIHASERGDYAALRLLPEGAEESLAAALQARTGQRLTVRLVHDGSAGALVTVGEGRVAPDVVLTLGTAVGVGMPPEDAAMLRALDADLRLDTFAQL